MVLELRGEKSELDKAHRTSVTALLILVPLRDAVNVSASNFRNNTLLVSDVLGLIDYDSEPSHLYERAATTVINNP